MTSQLSLDDARPGLARRDHPATAKQAATMVTLRTGTARALVLAFLAGCPDDGGGYTDEEIAEALRMPSSTERPRRVELVDAGWVEPVPETTRPSSWGKAMQVWRATAAGRVELRRCAT